MSASGLADPAVNGGRVPGLAYPRVQPDIGDQLVGVVEPGEVTHRSHDRDPGDRVDPGDRHQPSDRWIKERFTSQFLVHDREFVGVEVELAQQRRHRRFLVSGQLLTR